MKVVFLTFITICFGCATAKPLKDVKVDTVMKELDSICSKPIVNNIQEEYNKKFGLNSFKVDIVNLASNSSHKVKHEISSKAAVDQFLLRNSSALKIFISYFEKCSKDLEIPCKQEKTKLIKLQKNIDDCSREKSESCYEVAIQYKQFDYEWFSLEFANRACELGSSSGCKFYKNMSKTN